MLRAVVPTALWSCVIAAAAAQQFQFQVPPKRSVPPLVPGIGSLQQPVVSGDVDGDGDSDLVLTSSGTVLLFRRTPTGFLPPVAGASYPGSPARMELVDLDGDGYLDLLLEPDLSLFRYDPLLGDFAALALPPQLSQLNAPTVLADLDGDGWRDLVVAPPANNLEVWRGGPAFQFTLAQALPLVPRRALRPMLVDIDGDGDLDVVAARDVAGLAVFVNQNGVLADRTSLLPTDLPAVNSQVVADFDGDGFDDYLATSIEGACAVAWGSSSGLTSIQSLPAFHYAVHSLRAADFDGDGRDEVMAFVHPGLLELCEFEGGRQFTSELLPAAATSVVGVADVDSDGHPDFLFMSNGRLACLRRGRFDAVEAPDFGNALGGRLPTAQLAVGDVDGDRRPDLLQMTPTWTQWHADGGGGHVASTGPATIPTSLVPARVELADLDGDGDLDYVANAGSGLYVARNDGAAGFAFAPPVGASLVRVDDLRVADVDADGRPDVVIAAQAGIELRRGLGSAQLGAPELVRAMPQRPQCLELVDVDGDGDLDLVTDDVAASGLTHVVLANDGAGNFAPDPAFFVNLGSVPTSIRAGDLDGDGDQDLAVADGTPRIFRNDGHGVFADTTPFVVPPLVGTVARDLVVADLDEDGHLDIAAPMLGSAVLLLGSASGVFRDATASRVAPQFFGSLAVMLRAVDVDGDGDLDLVLTGSSGEHVLTNHLRQCRSTAVPMLGSIASAELVTVPSFGSSGVALFLVGLQLPTPLRVPGIAGQLEADPSTLQMLVSLPTSSAGVSTVFFAVPALPQLFGLDVIYQGVVLPSAGPAGFTNAIHERILQP